MSTPPSRTQKRQRQKEGAHARRAAELAAARKQQRTRRIIRIVIFAVIAAALLLAMSVFGGKDKKDDTASSTSSTSTKTTETTTATTAVSNVKPPTCSGPDGSNTDLTKKPTVAVPAKKATELTCRDLVVGTGKEVKPGDTVSVQYVGVAQSTGKQFDASWDRGTDPVTFPLGNVIKGWTDGIPGMKVGGRRLLVIPGDQAYGPAGRGPDIGPDETLVFIVDVQDTKSA
jgi:peptidylprolyl isomerase